MFIVIIQLVNGFNSSVKFSHQKFFVKNGFTCESLLLNALSIFLFVSDRGDRNIRSANVTLFFRFPETASKAQTSRCKSFGGLLTTYAT